MRVLTAKRWHSAQVQLSLTIVAIGSVQAECPVVVADLRTRVGHPLLAVIDAAWPHHNGSGVLVVVGSIHAHAIWHRTITREC